MKSGRFNLPDFASAASYLARMKRPADGPVTLEMYCVCSQRGTRQESGGARRGRERYQGTDATEADEKTREEETTTDQLPVYKEQRQAEAELPVARHDDDNPARRLCVPVCCIL